MFDSSNDPSVQAFRCSLTDEIIHIPVVTDPKGCKRIVLWSDIQDVFDDTQSIRNGDSMVPFVKDEGSRCVMPLRIAYHAGVVLEVVRGSNKQIDTSTGGTVLTNTVPEDEHYDVHDDSLNRPPEDTTTIIDLLLQYLSKANTGTPSSPPDTNKMLELAVLPHNDHTHQLDGCCNSIIGGKGDLAASVKNSIDIHANQLQIEIDRCEELQYHLVDFQKHIQLQLQQTRNDVYERQTTLNEMRGQTYDRLSAASKRLRDVLLQGYELHDSPIPSLFIILPKPTGPHHKLTGPESEQFRVHFLCECETLAMSDDSKSQPKIHLARHEGYDLVKPMEFFEKYGSHILATMHMIKYETITNALSASCLTNIEATYDIAKDNEYLEYFGNDLTDQFDYTINYLQSVLRILSSGDVAMFHEGPENLKPLERFDLKQLQSYMDFKEHENAPARLYRVATPEGHIKWVCVDHYITPKRLTFEALQGIVAELNGEFIDQLSKIIIIIGSQATATRFYKAMDSVRGLQELKITLGWDAAMADLQLLADAVTKAGLISLTINGSHFNNPLRDAFNSGRRYNPIIQLGSNGRLQHLGLLGFNNFLSRFNRPSGSFSTLRMLSVEFKRRCNEENISPFLQSLDYCPLLVSLEVNMDSSYKRVRYGDEILSRLPKLKSLEFSQGYSLTARISEGRVRDMTLIISAFRVLMDLSTMLFNQGHLTHVTVESYEYPYKLTDILIHNPKLHTLRILDSPRFSNWIVKDVISTRTSLLQDHGFCHLRTFELISYEMNSIQSHVSFAKDSTSFDMVSWIQLRIARGPNSICMFLEDFGWSVVSLDGWVFNDRLATALYAGISEKGSQIETLDIDPFNLENTGLDQLANVIEQSPCFKRLHFRMQAIDRKDRIERAQGLIHRFSEQLTGLTFSGVFPEQWLPQVALSFPTRHGLPNLTSLTLECLTSDHPTIQSGCRQWIADMIATSSQELQSKLGSSSLSQDDIHTRQLFPSADGSLSDVLLKPMTTIALRGFSLDSEDWRVLIEVMDWHTLQNVLIRNNNFGEEQFDLLMGRICEIKPGMVSLESLDLQKTYAVQTMDRGKMKATISRLRKGMPWIK
ncbi:hypothetical protein BGX31_010468, partial [Mortierella sp. GBA43]